jgi:hypothetical protein
MNCKACCEAGDMVPYLRELRTLYKVFALRAVEVWINLTEDVIRLKHQECDDHDKCVCLHRLPI